MTTTALRLGHVHLIVRVLVYDGRLTINTACYIVIHLSCIVCFSKYIAKYIHYISLRLSCVEVGFKPEIIIVPLLDFYGFKILKLAKNPQMSLFGELKTKTNREQYTWIYLQKVIVLYTHKMLYTLWGVTSSVIAFFSVFLLFHTFFYNFDFYLYISLLFSSIFFVFQCS